MTALPCRSNPDRQFPSPNSPGATERAKQVCRTGNDGRPCDFLAECLEKALPWAVEGIWGATDEDDRKRIRARLGIVPASVSFTSGPTRASAIRRMHRQNVPVTEIAARLQMSTEGVQRVLREDAKRGVA